MTRAASGPTRPTPDIAAGQAALAKSAAVMAPILARQDAVRAFYKARFDRAVGERKEAKDAR